MIRARNLCEYNRIMQGRVRYSGVGECAVRQKSSSLHTNINTDDQLRVDPIRAHRRQKGFPVSF